MARNTVGKDMGTVPDRLEKHGLSGTVPKLFVTLSVHQRYHVVSSSALSFFQYHIL